MHSSRMRTACSSSHHREVSTSPGQIPLNFPLGCGPGPDPPQLSPWVWAWTRSPSTSPFGVGQETPQSDPPKVPLGSGPGNLQSMLGYPLPQDQEHTSLGTRHPPGTRCRPPGPGTSPGPGTPPPVNRILDTRL